MLNVHDHAYWGAQAPNSVKVKMEESNHGIIAAAIFWGPFIALGVIQELFKLF